MGGGGGMICMRTRRVSCGARRGNRVWKDEKVGAEKRQEGWG